MNVFTKGRFTGRKNVQAGDAEGMRGVQNAWESVDC